MGKMVFVVTFIVLAGGFLRCVMAMRLGGHKAIFKSFHDPIDATKLRECLAVLGEMQFSEETLTAIVNAFTESDRRAFAQFLHAFQTACVHTVPFPVGVGARIYVPGAAFGDETSRTTFTSKVKQDLTNSKLESYI